MLAGHPPSFGTWQAICDLYGWPHTFADGDLRIR